MKKLLSLILTLAIAVSSFGIVACASAPAAKTQFAITVSSNAGGSVTTSSSKVELGEAVTLTITPETGYVLKDLKLNGRSISVADDTFELLSADRKNYSLENILRDYKIVAEFIEATSDLDFVGEGTSNIENKAVAYGGKMGQLPTAYAVGKKFVGWKTDAGIYVDENTAVDFGGTLNLTPEFATLTAEEIEAQIPFSNTVVYHDASATKYGLAWHTSDEPIQPVVQVVEGETEDFTNAKLYETTYKTFVPVGSFDNMEYIVNAVIDELEFNTTYSVRFGDASAETWSAVHSFTTREENLSATEFVYITDTQERDHWGDNSAYGGALPDSAFWKQTMRGAVDQHGLENIDLMLHGGDIFERGDHYYYIEEMLTSMNNWLFEIPTQVIAGNHEKAGDSGSLGYDCVAALYNIDYPDKEGVNNAELIRRGPVYSFDYGPVHFTMLRSNDIFYRHVNKNDDEVKNCLTDIQVDWLKQDLAAAAQNEKTKWNIVVMHESSVRMAMVTAKTGTSNSATTLLEQLLPVFNEGNVDLVLFGHDHMRYSSLPLIWDETIEMPELLVSMGKSWLNEYRNGHTLIPNDYWETNPDVARYLARRKAVVGATVGAQVEHDGVMVDTFTYLDETKRGTIYHEIWAAGNQNKADTGEEYPLLTEILRVPAIRGGNYSAYAYIEATEDTLIVRDYGVYGRAAYNIAESESLVGKETSAGVPIIKYFDGFKLTK